MTGMLLSSLPLWSTFFLHLRESGPPPPLWLSPGNGPHFFSPSLFPLLGRLIGLVVLSASLFLSRLSLGVFCH